MYWLVSIKAAINWKVSLCQINQKRKHKKQSLRGNVLSDPGIDKARDVLGLLQNQTFGLSPLREPYM